MKALTVVALILASATVLTGSTASAQPREERDLHVPYNSRLRPPPPPQHRVGDWVKLATPTPTRFGTEWITIGRSQGAFRALRIEATSGIVELRRVVVAFADGKTATFNVDQALNARRPDARIDFGTPKNIAWIAVTTSRFPTGVYVVYGSWGLSPTGVMVAGR